MRQALVTFMFVIGVVTLSGCIVHHKNHPPPSAKRCSTHCASYAKRRVCNRKCRVWRNGVCVSYKQHCHHTRYCKRHVTRCR